MRRSSAWHRVAPCRLPDCSDCVFLFGPPPSISRGSPRTRPKQASDNCKRPEKSERRPSTAGSPRPDAQASWSNASEGDAVEEAEGTRTSPQSFLDPIAKPRLRRPPLLQTRGQIRPRLRGRRDPRHRGDLGYDADHAAEGEQESRTGLRQ